jgi:hypothetical protein
MILPLCEWKVLIEKYQAQSSVADAESVQSFIDELSEKHGEIKNELLQKDLT